MVDAVSRAEEAGVLEPLKFGRERRAMEGRDRRAGLDLFSGGSTIRVCSRSPLTREDIR
jgi:hypothetical protein